MATGEVKLVLRYLVAELELAWVQALRRERAATADPEVRAPGSARVTASASVGRNGRLKLRVTVKMYMPVRSTGHTTEGDRESAGYEQGVAIEDRYDAAGEVRAFDLDGKRIEPGKLAELLPGNGRSWCPRTAGRWPRTTCKSARTGLGSSSPGRAPGAAAGAASLAPVIRPLSGQKKTRCRPLNNVQRPAPGVIDSPICYPACHR
jgi:hypothetical protein